MHTDEKKPPEGGLIGATTQVATYDIKQGFRDLVTAAADFKYWLDIQPVGKVFHPGGGDVRDSPAYKSAVKTLDAAQAVLKSVQRT